MKFYPFLFGFGVAQIVPFEQMLPILTSPVVQVNAGQDLVYQLSNFRNASCSATLSFLNATFLPISAIAQPKNCGGDLVARLKIPESVPNGTAAVQWQCSGAEGTSVNLMVISGGLGDYEAFLRDRGRATVMVDCRSNFTDPNACQPVGVVPRHSTDQAVEIRSNNDPGHRPVHASPGRPFGVPANPKGPQPRSSPSRAFKDGIDELQTVAEGGAFSRGPPSHSDRRRSFKGRPVHASPGRPFGVPANPAKGPQPRSNAGIGVLQAVGGGENGIKYEGRDPGLRQVGKPGNPTHGGNTYGGGQWSDA